ncbi:Mechano-sensitive ion channel [Elusimicrobium minutum Pei191]|uniref:Mechano-sensitive ion channel n=1 Tax=Elusimicrobium minutum (strain Pei191) TaxID=445932 RepID=B2KDK7_ELUMP|nr:mechanosensitive ion channel domain-containing protein [Elusimicrobium minutum]ACC98603.1 Mechano-sensitive ion channel [Elusimicrobium minutum Pei191]
MKIKLISFLTASLIMFSIFAHAQNIADTATPQQVNIVVQTKVQTTPKNTAALTANDGSAASPSKDAQITPIKVESKYFIITIVKDLKISYILLKQLVIALIILLITLLLIKIINVLYYQIINLIWKKKDKTNDALHNIIDIGRQTKFLLAFIRVIRFILIALILYIFCSSFLFLFPVTKGIASKLFLLIKGPLVSFVIAVWDYLPNLIAIIIILAISYGLSKFMRLAAKRVATGKTVIKDFDPDWAIPTYHITLVVLIAFTFIFLFPHLPKSNSAVFKGISVFLGVLLSLGSTTFISNIVSGFVITYMSPFKLGDLIKMGDNVGNVIEKNGLVTRIKTIKNEVVTIPNSTIMTSNTINYTVSAKEYGLMLYAEVYVAYDVPWEKVNGALMQAAQNMPDILKTPPPIVIQTGLENSYAKYQLNVFTDNANKMFDIYSVLYKNIQDSFTKEKIELAVPEILSLKTQPYQPPNPILQPGEDIKK